MSSLLKCTFFGYGWHSMYIARCKALLAFQVSSSCLCCLHFSSYHLAGSHCVQAGSWNGLAGVHVRAQTSSRNDCVEPHTEFKSICSALGFWSSNSASVCPCAFISVRRQQFNHSSNLKSCSRNDTAEAHFYLSLQLQTTATCFSAFGVVCLFLSFRCFSR